MRPPARKKTRPLAAVASHPQTGAIAAIFGVVYLGMFLGGLPKLRLDRTGVALLAWQVRRAHLSGIGGAA